MNIGEINRIFIARGAVEAATTAEAAGLNWAAEKIRRGDWDAYPDVRVYSGVHYTHRVLNDFGTARLVGVYEQDGSFVQYVFINDDGTRFGHKPLGKISRKEADRMLSKWFDSLH